MKMSELKLRIIELEAELARTNSRMQASEAALRSYALKLHNTEAKLAEADLAVATFVGEIAGATGHGDTIADMLAQIKPVLQKK